MKLIIMMLKSMKTSTKSMKTTFNRRFIILKSMRNTRKSIKPLYITINTKVSLKKKSMNRKNLSINSMRNLTIPNIKKRRRRNLSTIPLQIKLMLKFTVRFKDMVMNTLM